MSKRDEANVRKPLRLAVLISGGGRTMQNVADHIASGKLDAAIELVIASRADIAGVERAQRLGVATHVLVRREFADAQTYSQALFNLIRPAKVDLVVLAGWLNLLVIPDDFVYKLINTHPALLPSFGGRGMFGRHVHEAVLAAGCKISGCTVHFADQTYDTGPIIVQRCCPVEPDDTPDTLAARVFAEECVAVPQAIQLLAEGRVEIKDRCTRITGPLPEM